MCNTKCYEAIHLPGEPRMSREDFPEEMLRVHSVLKNEEFASWIPEKENTLLKKTTYTFLKNIKRGVKDILLMNIT